MKDNLCILLAFMFSLYTTSIFYSAIAAIPLSAIAVLGSGATCIRCCCIHVAESTLWEKVLVVVVLVLLSLATIKDHKSI